MLGKRSGSYADDTVLIGADPLRRLSSRKLRGLILDVIAENGVDRGVTNSYRHVEVQCWLAGRIVATVARYSPVPVLPITLLRDISVNHVLSRMLLPLHDSRHVI